MVLLLIASLVWAFSFGLIKKYLGGLDANFVSFVRLALSFLLFLPLLKPRKNSPAMVLRLFMIGMVQFGLMYVFYIQSFRFLAAHQVALFTIFTPLYVAVVDDMLEKRFRPLHFWTALMAVAGTAVIVYSGLGKAGLLTGFVLVQASNLCFALGQVFYRRLLPMAKGWQDRAGFAWLYLGGTAAALLAMLFFSGPLSLRLSASQLLVLLYLGVAGFRRGIFSMECRRHTRRGRHSGRFQQCQGPPGRFGLAAVFRRICRLAETAWRRGNHRLGHLAESPPPRALDGIVAYLTKQSLIRTLV